MYNEYIIFDIIFIQIIEQDMENERLPKMNFNEIINYNDVIMSVKKKVQSFEEIERILNEFSRAIQSSQTKAFYQKLKLSQFYEMLAIVFESRDGKNQRIDKLTFKLINMFKTGSGFAQFIADKQQFDNKCIFGFLEEEQIDENILTIFGDIFITLARNNPVKVLQIIKQQTVQNILIRRVKKSQVMNILYTAIFCLNSIQSKHYQNFILQVLDCIIRSPFQNNDGQSMFLNCVCSNVSSALTNQQDIYEQNNKQNHNKQSCFRKQKNLDFCKQNCINKTHCFFNQQSQFYFEQVIESVQNLQIMIQQISLNLSGIYLGTVQMLLDLILKRSYIKQLFNLLSINEKSARNNKNDLSNKIIKLVYEILKLYRVHAQQNYNAKNNINSAKTLISLDANNIKKQKRERRQSIQIILQNFQKAPIKNIFRQQKIFTQQTATKLLQICKSISYFLNLYLNQNAQVSNRKNLLQHCSGLKIEAIGFERYNILQIHSQILTVIKNTTYNIHKKYELKKALPTLIPLIQQCLSAHRWSNIAQKLIVKTIKKYVENCYADFYHQVVNIEKKSNGFLGFLIEHFRNKFHIFLNTMNFTTQGDRHTIFQISQIISTELHSNRDLIWLFQFFPQWKVFMEKDLLEYQKSCVNKKYFDQTMIDPLLKNISEIFSQKSIEQLKNSSVEELIDFYKDHWSDQNHFNTNRNLKTKNNIYIIQQIASSQSIEVEDIAKTFNFKNSRSLKQLVREQ